MATYTKGLDLYHAQLERFRRSGFDMRRGHWDLAEKSMEDALELLSGTPTGKERLRMLRRLNNPFARVSLAEALASGDKAGRTVGRRRRSSKEDLAAEGIKGDLPSLPIGAISFRLKRAMRLTRLRTNDSIQDLGLGPQGVDYAKYVLGPGGTRKMIARGFQAEIRRRWRPRNKAFVDWIREQQRKP